MFHVFRIRTSPEFGHVVWKFQSSSGNPCYRKTCDKTLVSAHSLVKTLLRTPSLVLETPATGDTHVIESTFFSQDGLGHVYY